MTRDQRAMMIVLIEYYCYCKHYRWETLFLAINLADRYIIELAKIDSKLPKLAALACTCIFIAAKAEEHKIPNLHILVDIFKFRIGVTLQAKSILDLEERILNVLEFSVYCITPLNFLGRFSRIFDTNKNNNLKCSSEKINEEAIFHCLQMAKNTAFIECKPSRIAAISLIYALNLQN